MAAQKQPLNELLHRTQDEYAHLLAAARRLNIELGLLKQRISQVEMKSGTPGSWFHHQQQQIVDISIIYLFNPGCEHESRWLEEDGQAANYRPLLGSDSSSVVSGAMNHRTRRREQQPAPPGTTTELAQ